MIKRTLGIIGLVGLSACSFEIPDFRPSVIAPPPVAAPVIAPQSAKARFVTAAAAQGCVVDQTTTPAILAAATLSREDLARILTELRAEGRGQIAADGASFEITTGACA